MQPRHLHTGAGNGPGTGEDSEDVARRRKRQWRWWGGVGCLTDGAKGCCDSGLAWLPLPVAVTLGFPPVAPSRRNSQFPTGRQATRQPGSWALSS